jgi:hypothetical protein
MSRPPSPDSHNSLSHDPGTIQNQLTATARFSDGTTTDVTTDAQWGSSNPSVITVTSSGVVTVVGFGVTGISARYSTQADGVEVRATPPGTFIVFGRVREPGAGGIPGVRVVERQSGHSTLTDDVGVFSLGGSGVRV